MRQTATAGSFLRRPSRWPYRRADGAGRDRPVAAVPAAAVVAGMKVYTAMSGSVGYAARSRFANAAAAAPGSSASVIARTTTTRVAPD